MSKKVFVISTNHWTSPFQVGTHELTKEFIKAGWKVAFISDPISPLHLLKTNNSSIYSRFNIYMSGGEFYYYDQLWTYIPFTLLPPQNVPILRSKFIYENWNKFTFPNVYKKICKIGFDEVDLIYFDGYVHAFWLDKIKYKKSVLRIADVTSGFPKYTKHSENIERELARSVDLVVYTAHNLSSYVSNLSPKKSYYLSNGVNFDHFHNGSRQMPEEFIKIPEPRIVYIGAMDFWFNFELLQFAADQLPEYSFILIGNDSIAKLKFKNRKNIYLLGTRPYNDIPMYLHNSNVGIIPFNYKDFPLLVNSINPLKLYQYFACGLPVVAAKWDELLNINSPAVLYKDKDKFVQLLRKTLAEIVDIDSLISFARKADWSNKYKELIDELGF
jgi:hypothetical protein